ncbi:MAG: hypothetical protein FJZ86_09660 [Chloroflexi bacterium]|nr:hypothetical protein [Chloroflexota bacterium]
MSQKSKYPIIRISNLANRRADEIVEALEARGIDTSKTSVVSELILSMPIPQPTQPVEKKRRFRKAVSQSTVAAL